VRRIIESILIYFLYVFRPWALVKLVREYAGSAESMGRIKAQMEETDRKHREYKEGGKE
jgi:hypothetical protein